MKTFNRGSFKTASACCAENLFIFFLLDRNEFKPRFRSAKIALKNAALINPDKIRLGFASFAAIFAVELDGNFGNYLHCFLLLSFNGKHSDTDDMTLKQADGVNVAPNVADFQNVKLR